mmetsp:Transcript_59870/g.143005  ORF Transcript_59870/g.143005 Transcript_59870/m.143005 type:complete len:590 (-) Transcript_59870:82-1851(-)
MARLGALVWLVLGARVLASPGLTQWQIDLMAKVEATAKELSDAAVPKLLANLDSNHLRQHLRECCPSLADLPAEDLLDLLQQQIEVSEVASGFPVLVDPTQMEPDAAGMSVDFGLNGSFFLNDWQAVLMHSTNPAEVWRNVSMQYTDAFCDLERQEAVLGIWPQGCNGSRQIYGNYTLDQCYALSDPSDFIFSYSCNGSQLTQNVWFQDSRKLTLASPGLKPVACPSEAPVPGPPQLADGQCRGYATQNFTQGWVMQDDAEVAEYGLKPFHQEGAPATLAESNERGVYAMVNSNLIDQGSPIYGDISAVFSNKYILNSTLLSAADTGLYDIECRMHTPFSWAPPVNCSAFEAIKQLGTLKHHNHLLLLNEAFWGANAWMRTTFLRMEGGWGSQALPGRSFLNYVEATLLGKLEFPSSVRFLIGAYPALFGTSAGRKLQSWARSRGWVLLWALGPNNKAIAEAQASEVGFNFELLTSGRSYLVNQRILDPSVFVNTTANGIVIPPDDVAKFEQKWTEVAELREKLGQVSNATMAQQWQETTEQLPELRMRPLQGKDCKEERQTRECVGVSLQGQCVCYGSEAISPAAFIV